MTFNEVLSQTIAMLQQHGWISYRALKHQFALDDTFLDDRQYELIAVQQRAAAPPLSAPAPAAAPCRQALALVEELGMRPLVAHCHWGFGTLFTQTTQSEQARPVLATALDLYRARDMTFWLTQTEVALAQVAGR